MGRLFGSECPGDVREAQTVELRQDARCWVADLGKAAEAEWQRIASAVDDLLDDMAREVIDMANDVGGAIVDTAETVGNGIASTATNVGNSIGKKMRRF